MSDTKPVIAVRNLTKTYSMGAVEVRALRGVSLVVDRGDFVAIMGASGTGKCDADEHPRLPRRADDGRVPARRRRRRATSTTTELAYVRNRKIGFVFQSFNLIPRTSARRERRAAAGLRAACKRAERRRSARSRRSKRSGSATAPTTCPRALGRSAAARRDRARARHAPAMILADEPTGNLDSQSTREVLDIFARLNARGRTSC